MGWSLTSTDREGTWQPEDNYVHNSTSNATIYAIWRLEVNFTVSYRKIGEDTWVNDENTLIEGETVRVVLPGYTDWTNDYTLLMPPVNGSSYDRLTRTEGDAVLTEVKNNSGTIVAYDITMGTSKTKIRMDSYFELTYNKNTTDTTLAGMPSPNPTYVICAVDNTLSSATPTRTAYKFDGWSLTSTGEKAYDASGTFYFETLSNQTLYAHWSKKTYTITYSAPGASNVPSNGTKTHDTTFYVSSQKPTKSGYDFVNWKATDGTTYSSGGAYTKNEATTLTAQWKTSTIAVTGVSLSPSSEQWLTNNGSTVTITATVSPSNATNKTVSWSSSSSGVASVSEGKVTAKSAGKTTITASAGGKSASVSVYVYNAKYKEGYGAIYVWASTNTTTHAYDSSGYISTVDDNDKLVLKTVSGWYHQIKYFWTPRSSFMPAQGGHVFIDPGGTAKSYFSTYNFNWT